MRRLLFASAVFGAIAACGSLVGVKDLDVNEAPEEKDAEADVALLPDTSAFEVDDGIEVKPPVDAGCEASLFGTFAPTAFASAPGDENDKMHWQGDFSAVQTKGNGSYNLQALALSGGVTVSKTVKFSGFQTFVPDNQRVVGLAIDITARASDAGFFKDNVVRLTAADDSTTSANHAIDDPWPTEVITRRYGGPNTMWELERSLETPTLLNQNGFGLVYVVVKPNNNVFPALYVDQLSLSVYVCPR